MVKFISTIKAVITRLLFASHGFIAIWQVTTFKKNPVYWYLSSPIVLLFFEGIFTIAIKTHQEWKWFCPSVFLYLASVVPAIWLLELDKLESRFKPRTTNINISETIDISNLAAEDLKNLEKIFGSINFKLPEIQISTETWVTLIEQFLMLVLIVGRWMLPKGDLTRDQLSQLLLVYIGTAADIIEFFDSFKEDKIGQEYVLVYLTLGIWSWSLMQFTVVLTATKSRKSRLSSGTTIKRKVPTKTSCCSIDTWAITLNIILQDAPFLAFRLIIIIHYHIVSYMNIFFTCKNTLVILLQLYRLCVVQSENRTKRKRKKIRQRQRYEVPNISIISRDDAYKYENSNSKKRRRNYDYDDSSESDDCSIQDNDIHELSVRDLPTRNKRNIRQDTGYSTSSSRTSPKINKTQKNDKRRVLTRHREVIDSDEFNDIDDNDVNIKRSKNKRLKKDDYKSTGNDKERGKTGKSKKKIINLTSEECEEKNISVSKSNSETDTESDYRYINYIFFYI
ncbi:transmembrane protein 26 isoform X1 [Microplitis mediator]|uniref:transmembrane protein 26 isoform X1 n=1 Tax=Microplitis mediator TaxID=375433 RepID=UPI002555881D|nr:transmembrane protein 26 isoform X1 [Microplitis mediator]